jgi:hypothetical protein
VALRHLEVRAVVHRLENLEVVDDAKPLVYPDERGEERGLDDRQILRFEPRVVVHLVVLF